jgi:hypothetical protein
MTLLPVATLGNIMHFSGTGGNCCNYGDRIPAVWFHPAPGGEVICAQPLYLSLASLHRERAGCVRLSLPPRGRFYGGTRKLYVIDGQVGLGRTLALHHRSSTLYQIY